MDKTEIYKEINLALEEIKDSTNYYKSGIFNRLKELTGYLNELLVEGDASTSSLREYIQNLEKFNSFLKYDKTSINEATLRNNLLKKLEGEEK